jgi:hypothetical protein
MDTDTDFPLNSLPTTELYHSCLVSYIFNLNRAVLQQSWVTGKFPITGITQVTEYFANILDLEDLEPETISPEAVAALPDLETEEMLGRWLLGPGIKLDDLRAMVKTRAYLNWVAHYVETVTPDGSEANPDEMDWESNFWWVLGYDFWRTG